MIKRIFAWVLLVAFVLLVANIIFIGYYRGLSAIIYAIIAVAFILFNKKK